MREAMPGSDDVSSRTVDWRSWRMDSSCGLPGRRRKDFAAERRERRICQAELKV